MADFSVKTSGLSAVVGDEQEIARRLLAVEDRINDVKNSINWQVSSSSNIRTRLGNAAQQTSQHRRAVSDMGSGLSSIIDWYEKTEARIIENAIPVATGVGVATSEDGVDNPFSLDNLLDIVGTAGPVGGIISTLVGAVTDYNSGENRWEIANDLVACTWGSAFDLHDNIKGLKTVGEDGTKTTWKDFVGLNANYVKIIKKTEGGWQRFKSVVKASWKDSFDDLLSVKGMGATVLSAVGNGFSNYEEFGGFTDRMIAETVTETVVDWAKDAAIGAAVAAGFAAAGVAAPVVAVGAATVAISVGADWVCEKVCGKKVTEFVSDFFLDKTERVFNNGNGKLR